MSVRPQSILWYYTIITHYLLLLKKLEVSFWSLYIGLAIPKESTDGTFKKAFILS